VDQWLTYWTTIDPMGGPTAHALRLGAALAFGVSVAVINRWARRGEEIAPTFQTTLVLLSVLIAMSTQVIGDNIARAFSLAGALSVVRFRTVVKDTQDTAFVIFAVVVGMAAGANLIAVGLVGLIVVAIASLFLWPPGRAEVGRQPALFSFRVSQAEGMRRVVEDALAVSADHYRLISVGTAKKGASLALTYRVRLRPNASPADLVSEMIRLDGIEDVKYDQEN
jgi:hypothetical protein